MYNTTGEDTCTTQERGFCQGTKDTHITQEQGLLPKAWDPSSQGWVLSLEKWDPTDTSWYFNRNCEKLTAPENSEGPQGPATTDTAAVSPVPFRHSVPPLALQVGRRLRTGSCADHFGPLDFLLDQQLHLSSKDPPEFFVCAKATDPKCSLRTVPEPGPGTLRSPGSCSVSFSWCIR